MSVRCAAIFAVLGWLFISAPRASRDFVAIDDVRAAIVSGPATLATIGGLTFTTAFGPATTVAAVKDEDIKEPVGPFSPEAVAAFDFGTTVGGGAFPNTTDIILSEGAQAPTWPFPSVQPASVAVRTPVVDLSGDVSGGTLSFVNFADGADGVAGSGSAGSASSASPSSTGTGSTPGTGTGGSPNPGAPGPGAPGPGSPGTAVPLPSGLAQGLVACGLLICFSLRNKLVRA